MAINNNAEINSYLEGLQKSNPSLYNLLRLLSDDVNYVVDVLIPETARSTLATVFAPAPKSGPVDTFTYQIFPTSIRFNWTTSDVKSVQFEVRRGATWDTAAFQFRISGLQADINPITNVGGTHFIIRSVNVDGVISDDELALDVAFNFPLSVIINYQVIDNNVLLRWTSPPGGSFAIDHYEIFRNGVLLGIQASTFFVYFETVAATVLYDIRAVDVAGNISGFSEVAVIVNEPADFVLYDTRISAFGGTKTNVLLENGKLIGPLDLTKTWTTHFTTPGWNTIADQVAAGYPYYGQPAVATGKYVEVIDYGSVLNDVIVNADWISNVIASTAGLNVQFESSLDNISYTTITAGPSVFYSSFRYIRVTLNFTSDLHGLIEVTQLRVFLDVKLVLTSGSVIVTSTDNDAATGSTHVGGKYVAFIKPYKDVDSITLTINSVSPITAIFDFIDIANPDGFKAYAIDSSGNRVGQTVNWKVRGKL